MHAGFWLGNVKEGHHLEDIHINERMILKWILTILGSHGLAQFRDKHLALLNVVMKLSGCIKCG